MVSTVVWQRPNVSKSVCLEFGLSYSLAAISPGFRVSRVPLIYPLYLSITNGSDN